MTRILTNRGIRFDLLEPTAEMVHPNDIAFSLARLCRFNGHTRKHYSVAEHSYRVHELVEPEHQLHALLHDATEAYIGDMTRPLKLAMRGYAQDMAVDDVYGQVEQRIWLAICERFDLEPELPDQVKEADMYMLAVERRDLMPAHPDAWECIQGIELPAWHIKPWSAEEARDRYFQRLMSLLSTTHRMRVMQ
nr:phosphohydrolase [uncultured Pseudomonas sp.]